MKTFIARNAAGEPVEVEQLATFAVSIQGQQFRFVVTREGSFPPVVTHRISGAKVCQVGLAGAATGDWKLAGMAALKRLLGEKGEARVASALRAAEAKAMNGSGKA